MSTSGLYSSTIATHDADADTIIDQIGPTVLAAVKARDFIDQGDGVRFTVGRHPYEDLVFVLLQINNRYLVERVRLTREHHQFHYQSVAVKADVDANDVADVVAELGAP